METFNFIRKCLIILLFIQLETSSWAGKAQMSASENEKTILEKLKATSPDLLLKGQRRASMKLQANFGKALSAMSGKRAAQAPLVIPMEIKDYIRLIMAAIKSGQFNDAMFQSLPTILMNGRGNQAEQIQIIIKDVMPRAPEPMAGPLQGLFDFVKANQAGVNKLVGKLLAGTPSLLNGVVGSLASSVGATNAAIGGSTESLNVMVGGLLASLPVNGLLPG